MKTQDSSEAECDWCGATGDFDITFAGDDLLCDDCKEKCNKTAIPAAPGTGVDVWEISPCLMHNDPRDGSQYVETYETLDEARDTENEDTGRIFWGVYALMRAGYISSVIRPSMHIADFQSIKDAYEFVRAMGGKTA